MTLRAGSGVAASPPDATIEIPDNMTRRLSHGSESPSRTGDRAGRAVSEPTSPGGGGGGGGGGEEVAAVDLGSSSALKVTPLSGGGVVRLHRDQITSLCLSDDRSVVATTSKDGSLRITPLNDTTAPGLLAIRGEGAWWCVGVWVPRPQPRVAPLVVLHSSRQRTPPPPIPPRTLLPAPHHTL